MSPNDVLQELNRIAKEHRGVLRPVDVVTAARVKTSPLHSHFQWDNSKAAEQWRLHQARNLIRFQVTLIEGHDEPIRAFANLTTDRGKNCYRPIVKILGNETRYAQLLADALNDAKLFAEKYRHLKELAGVIKAIEEL